MKTTIKTLLTLLLSGSITISMIACNTPTEDSVGDTTTSSAPVTTTSAITTDSKPEPPAPVSPMETLAKLPGVVSLTRYEGEMPADTVGYEIIFHSGENGELKIAADIVLPVGFEKGNASLIFYFPEVGLTMRDVAHLLVSRRIGVVRFYARGTGNSEGIGDVGGTEMIDALTLFSLCEEAGLTANRRNYVAGSSSGSINALRMAAELGEKVDGVSVTNVVSDLAKYLDARGGNLLASHAALIGGTAEEIPEAYQLRSACYFADRFKCPVLFIEYTENTQFFPTEQYDLLEDALKNANIPYERYKISDSGSDFVGEAGQKMLSWIASHG